MADFSRAQAISLMGMPLFYFLQLQYGCFGSHTVLLYSTG